MARVYNWDVKIRHGLKKSFEHRATGLFKINFIH